MLKTALTLPLLGLLWLADQSPDVPVLTPEYERAFWELMLMMCGGITVVSGAAVIVWKVAVKPHAEDFVRRLARVEKQVTPNGSSTNAEREVSTADRLVKVERVMSANARHITQLRKHDREHEQAGRDYAAKLVAALRRHGIEVPDPPKENDEA